MDNPDAQNTLGDTGIEVIVNQSTDLAGEEGMKVQGPVSGQRQRFIQVIGGHFV